MQTTRYPFFSHVRISQVVADANARAGRVREQLLGDVRGLLQELVRCGEEAEQVHMDHAEQHARVSGDMARFNLQLREAHRLLLTEKSEMQQEVACMREDKATLLATLTDERTAAAQAQAAHMEAVGMVQHLAGSLVKGLAAARKESAECHETLVHEAARQEMHAQSLQTLLDERDEDVVLVVQQQQRAATQHKEALAARDAELQSLATQLDAAESLAHHDKSHMADQHAFYRLARGRRESTRSSIHAWRAHVDRIRGMRSCVEYVTCRQNLNRMPARVFWAWSSACALQVNPHTRCLPPCPCSSHGRTFANLRFRLLFRCEPGLNCV